MVRSRGIRARIFRHCRKLREVAYKVTDFTPAARDRVIRWKDLRWHTLALNGETILAGKRQKKWAFFRNCPNRAAAFGCRARDFRLPVEPDSPGGGEDSESSKTFCRVPNENKCKTVACGQFRQR